MNRNKLLWFDARNLQNEKDVLALVFNKRFEYLLIKPEQIATLKVPSRIKFVVDVENQQEVKNLPKDVILFSKNDELLTKAQERKIKTAFHTTIKDEESMNNAWKTGLKHNFLVIELVSETNIPLELLIAQLQGKDVGLLKCVNTVQDAEISMGVMEVGSDGIVFKSEVFEEIIKMDEYMAQNELSKINLQEGVVVDVQHVGMGHRACIDTTTLLEKNEGMIIGSTSNGGLLVSSETHYLPYMELRPFRVNAGAIHSYIWTPENQTAYISELSGGKKVLCADTNGNAREVCIGRVKTEKRPLIKIEVEVNKVKINAIIQDDWHIRIFDSEGKPKNVSSVRKGDKLLTYLCDSGRHVGIKIEETIEEK